MNLLDALGVLSKSSKYSVSTLRTNEVADELQYLKDYLYITPDIQKDFEAAIAAELSHQAPNKIICLCGSSGDGKSEILTKLCTTPQYSNLVDFHLDATHSNSQHKSAVECLDELFDRYKENDKPLAIGINIGMLQKFIKKGSNRHSDIKRSFEAYFENRHVKAYQSELATFFDFECYPRLDFSEQKITSDFISAFLNKLTQPCENNPFYKSYLLDSELNTYVAKNFEVISKVSFQERLIELFGLARLFDEQFLIPRIFVDFIYQILSTDHEDGIVGNVFSDLDNEFSRCLKKIDPINFRSNELDSFYLEFATNTLSQSVKEDIAHLSQVTGKELTPEGIIRSAYLLQGNQLKSQLSNFFDNSPIHESLNHYLKLISLYQQEELSHLDEDECLNIVEDLLINSVLIYVNRMLPAKLEGFIVSRQLTEYAVCNKISVQTDIEWIEKHKLITTDFIPIPIIINDGDEYIFNLDINTLLQACNIASGYRPNRQNIEVVAKFDELIRHFVENSVEAESMKLISKHKTITINKNRRRYAVED